jgi:hypothetical protein
LASGEVGGVEVFFVFPKENVRLAAFLKKPVDGDLGIGGTGMSAYCCFLGTAALEESSCRWCRSADEGAEEMSLSLDELSVDIVFVVFEDPLPRSLAFSTENMLSSSGSGRDSALYDGGGGAGAGAGIGCGLPALAPPSNDFATVTSFRSRTLNEGTAIFAFSISSAFAVDFRRWKVNLGMWMA